MGGTWTPCPEAVAVYEHAFHTFHAIAPTPWTAVGKDGMMGKVVPVTTDILEAIGAVRLVPVIVMNNTGECLSSGAGAQGRRSSPAPRSPSARRRPRRPSVPWPATPRSFSGRGTVLRPEQVELDLEAGARCVVRGPGFSAEVVPACQADSGFRAVFPGVATATEMQMALEAGIEVVKVFPAEAIGSLTMLKAFAGALHHDALHPDRWHQRFSAG